MTELWTYSLDSKTRMGKIKKVTDVGEVVMAYIHVAAHDATRFMEQIILAPQAEARILELEKKLKSNKEYTTTLVARLEEEGLM